MSEHEHRLPTVTVKAANGRGYRIINAADFDPARHERLGAEAARPKLSPGQRKARDKSLAGRGARTSAEASAAIKSLLKRDQG